MRLHGKRSMVAPIKVLAVFVFHKVVALLRLLVDVVSWVPLDVGVDDGHNLAPMRRHVLLQLYRVWEQVLVPGKIPAQSSTPPATAGHRERPFYTLEGSWGNDSNTSTLLTKH